MPLYRLSSIHHSSFLYKLCKRDGRFPDFQSSLIYKMGEAIREEA